MPFVEVDGEAIDALGLPESAVVPPRLVATDEYDRQLATRPHRRHPWVVLVREGPWRGLRCEVERRLALDAEVEIPLLHARPRAAHQGLADEEARDVHDHLPRMAFVRVVMEPSAHALPDRVRVQPGAERASDLHSQRDLLLSAHKLPHGGEGAPPSALAFFRRFWLHHIGHDLQHLVVEDRHRPHDVGASHAPNQLFVRHLEAVLLQQPLACASGDLCLEAQRQPQGQEGERGRPADDHEPAIEQDPLCAQRRIALDKKGEADTEQDRADKEVGLHALQQHFVDIANILSDLQ
mmetsp:Transcript_79458/g.230703  ORF Transcript_79458/g.230703 Transcript_79458/m.230703 type:complete len:294 (-) Transcript_79458:134-1015(-)